MKRRKSKADRRAFALREWFRLLATDDFSENECREMLAELADVVSLDRIEEEHIDLYGKEFDLVEWEG